MDKELKKQLLNKRAYAFSIDFALIFLTNLVMAHLVNVAITQIFFGLPMDTYNRLTDNIWSYSNYTLLALGFAYFSIFNFINDGKSFGKMIIGLKIQNKNGEPLTLPASMARAFFNIACIKGFIFIFYMLYFRKDARSLTDIIFKTEVVLDEEVPYAVSLAPSTEKLILLNQLPDEGIYYEDEEAA